MKKIKKICFDKCEATVLSERVFTILSDGRVVKLVFITKFEGEDPNSSPSPIFCSHNKIYLVHNENIRFINDSLLNFVLWHEVGHIYHYDCYYERDNRDEYVEERADQYARSKVDTTNVTYEDVRVFCYWFCDACGFRQNCVSREFINEIYRRIKKLP